MHKNKVSLTPTFPFEALPRDISTDGNMSEEYRYYYYYLLPFVVVVIFQQLSFGRGHT
jgi:hypothetical protein